MGREIIIDELDWDSNYFNLRCGKVDLAEEDIDSDALSDLLSCINQFDFVSIRCAGNFVETNYRITSELHARLVDINIQLSKSIEHMQEPLDFRIIPSWDLDEDLFLQMRVLEEDYMYSKFVRDPHMRSRDAFNVYNEWIANSRYFDDKYFAIKLAEGKVAGFTLFRLSDNDITLELVKVNEGFRGCGIASELMRGINHFGSLRGCEVARVGTQLDNLPAINMYHKMGFREVSRTFVYHCWNVE